MNIDISYLRGLENPALESLAPDLVAFRDQVRKLNKEVRKSSCSSCEKRRRGIQLLRAVGTLREYVAKHGLMDVYNYLMETSYELQPAFDHA